MSGPSIPELMTEVDNLERLAQPTPSGQSPNGTGSQPDWPVLPDRALYGLVGAIVRAIEPHTEAATVAVLLNTLVYFGNAAGRVPHALVGSKRHGLNLHVIQVGETSKGRKGTSLSEVDSLFERVDPTWHDEHILGGLASGEGLTYHVRDATERDEGVSDKRLLIIEEEYASVLKVAAREGNTLSPILRQAWDGGAMRNLTKNSPLKATGAHVSLIGHITDSELRRNLTETESVNGYANRNLFICSRRSKVLPDGGGIPSYGGLVSQLYDALEFAPSCTQPVVRDEDARAIWHRVYGPLSEGRAGLLGAITSRAEAQVLRLSTLYAVMDCSAVVCPAHLLAALAVWEYAEQSARYIFGAVSGDPVADRIVMALKSAGSAGLTTSAINDLFGGHTKATRIHLALGELERMGTVVRRTVESKGRPGTIYVAVEEPTFFRNSAFSAD